MAISRLQAALTAATSEVTVAAANINFDFTLVKCEAPKEYLELGNALSTKRKEKAETGSTHITARRLGALFDGVCDPSPKLIKAYGRRVSEIAALTKEEPPNVKDSLLGPHIGIDGTSIWAAATSSPSALHVQLLACMLARLWPAAEAVSVWDEMVRERRIEIANRFEEGTPEKFATVAAAVQADISRASLAEWDASARAWLRCADRVERTNQDQLMLIIANVNIPVGNDMGVYLSVKAAWRSAVESMEKLVTGMPQAVNSGPTLLALSAWHLYPDILTFGGASKAQVRFKDSEIAEGGVLSVGLASPDGGEPRGVYWSLSLAHLTHYGRPVRREGSMSHSTERLSFNQFTQAVLGCLLGYWSSKGGDTRSGALLLVGVQRFLRKILKLHPEDSTSHIAARSFLRDSSHWWNTLADAASAWLESDGQTDEVHKLVRFGMRRSKKVLPETAGLGDLYFGLADESIILNCLTDPEQRISYLRERLIQGGMGMSQVQYPPLIRYWANQLGHCYATAVPMATIVRKRRGEDNEVTEYLHRRWLPEVDIPHPSEMCLVKGSLFLERVSSGRVYVDVWNETSQQYDYYSMVYGSEKIAAIFQRSGSSILRVRPTNIEDVISCLEPETCSVETLIHNIRARSDRLKPVNELMAAIPPLAMLFKVIPSARISIRTFDRPIQQTKWYEAHTMKETKAWLHTDVSPASLPFDITTAFACAAYMVAEVDVRPEVMEHVFAMAYEDSLYVDMRVSIPVLLSTSLALAASLTSRLKLLCDPSIKPEPYEMVHAIGNVGKPGLTLLIPPKEPVVRALQPSSWKVISNTLYDGKAEDHFQKTTMHLSFTEYYRPVHFGDDQGQDSQIHFLESVVSVYDAGEWVGDVDIPKALRAPGISALDIYLNACADLDGHKDAPSAPLHAISAEGWNDILDPPNEVFVVRAYNNWIARLAAVGILVPVLEGKDRLIQEDRDEDRNRLPSMSSDLEALVYIY